MKKRARESLEHGPRPIVGVAAPGTEGELPAVDPSIGAKQRYRVRVPTESTTLLLGARVPVSRTEDDTQQLGYDGVNAVTNAHFFASGTRSATMQSSGRVYVAATSDSLALVAKRDVLVGGCSSLTFAGAGPVYIVAGYGPQATTVSTSGETPESPVHANYTALTDGYDTAAAVTTASVGLLSAGLVLAGTVKKTDVMTILGYLGKAVSIIGKTKVIVEQATNRTVATRSGYGVDFWTDSTGAPEVIVHGKDHVTISAGVNFGSTTLFAPMSSIHAVGGLTAGLVGGVSASIAAGWSASVYALGISTVQALMSASVSAVNKASLESRKGMASIAGPEVVVGEVVSVPPQVPTVAASIAALMKVDFEVAMGVTALRMNGLMNDIDAEAFTSISLKCLPWTLEITPLGVTIKALTSGATIAPAKIVLDQVTSKVEITPAGIKAIATPHSIEVSPLQACVKGPFIVLG